MKRINTKVTKRIAAIVLTVAAAFSLMGCSVERNFTTTESHTYTDADGNTTTTTTTTTNHNGDVTTETTETTTSDEADAVETYESVPIEFDNQMGWDIGSFYLKMSSADEWSDNLFAEDEYLDNGNVMTGINITYNSEDRFIDVNVLDSQGEGIEFDKIELPADGAEKIVVTFQYNEEDGSYYATVD